MRIYKACIPILTLLMFSSASYSDVDLTSKESDLVAILKKSDSTRKDKADACRVLAVVGTKESVESLADLLDDEELSHMARYALETIDDPSVNDALRGSLDDVKGSLLVGVIGSLGVRKDSEAVESLIELLDNDDDFVVRASARALGSIGGRGVSRALRGKLETFTGVNRLAVCEGLLRLADTSLDSDNSRRALRTYEALSAADLPYQVRAAALRGTVLLQKEEGIPTLLAAIRGDDFAMVSAAGRTAQDLDGGYVTKALVDELPKLDADRQIVVIQALGERGDKDAMPAIYAVAKEGDSAARVAAIQVLPQFEDAGASTVLKDLTGDSDEAVATAAKTALEALSKN